MRLRRILAASLVGAAVLAVPGVATAAYPGANGRIAFEQGGVIYSVRPDGSDRRQLTTDTSSHSPRWSRDGRLVAFNRAGDIWVMRADGSAAHRITSGAASDINASWSPDGGRLVFSRTTDGTLAGRSLYVVSAAGGSGQRLTTRSDGCAVEPTWSATGRYVVYWDRCASGASGTGNAIRKVNTGTGAISVVVGVDGLAQPGGRVSFLGTGRTSPRRGQGRLHRRRPVRQLRGGDHGPVGRRLPVPVGADRLRGLPLRRSGCVP
jgi:dipeptidyl aminopeptidase/acylaminoacyl peptidase